MVVSLQHHKECDHSVGCLCELGHKATMLNVKMEIDGDVIKIDAPRTRYDEVKRLPGAAYRRQNQDFTAPLSWATCVIMRALFGDNLEVGERLAEWARRERIDRIDPSLEQKKAKDNKMFPDGRLYSFQRPAATLMALNKYAINGDEMRLGKTPTTIATLQVLHKQGERVFPAVIVCPPNVKRVWLDMLNEWWPEARALAPKSGIAAAEKAVKEVIEKNCDIVILHYEILALLSNLEGYGGAGKLKYCQECKPEVIDENGNWQKNNLQPSKCQVHKKILNQVEWATVISDEAHRIGDAAAQMTRAIKKISREANIRYALTGTPPEEPDRFWSVMNFLDPKEYPSKGKFRDFFTHTQINPWSGFVESVGWREETKPILDKFFQPRFIRRPKAAVHDFKEPIYQLLQPEMSPKQAKAYKDLRQTMMAEIEGGIFWVDSPLTKIARLRQLASAYGELIEEEGEEGLRVIGMKLSEPSSKLDTLEELLNGEFANEPVVVMAEQRQLIELAFERIGDRAVKLVGNMSDAARGQSIDRFQSGQVNRILCTTATGGEGISLNRSDTLIFLQRPWSLSMSVQAEARIYKEGVPSLIIDMVTPDTIEEKVLRSLKEKGDKLEELVNDAATVREWLK